MSTRRQKRASEPLPATSLPPHREQETAGSAAFLVAQQSGHCFRIS